MIIDYTYYWVRCFNFRRAPQILFTWIADLFTPHRHAANKKAVLEIGGFILIIALVMHILNNMQYFIDRRQYALDYMPLLAISLMLFWGQRRCDDYAKMPTQVKRQPPPRHSCLCYVAFVVTVIATYSSSHFIYLYGLYLIHYMPHAPFRSIPLTHAYDAMPRYFMEHCIDYELFICYWAMPTSRYVPPPATIISATGAGYQWSFPQFYHYLLLRFCRW